MADTKDLESKKADDTATPSAPEEETNTGDPKLGEDESKKTGTSENADDAGSSESSSDPVESPDDIDYKADYEEEKQKRKKAEDALVKLKKLNKKSDSDDDDDSSLTAEDIQETVKSELDKSKQQETEDLVDSLIEDMSGDENERKLIEFHYKNTINKVGFSRKQIKEDLAKAYAIANRKKLVKDISELKVSLKEKSSITNTGVGGNRDKPIKVKTDELSEANKTFLRDNYRAQGFSEEQIEEKIKNYKIKP